MNEIPGVKKYSNDNPFLNEVNDLTRSAYSNHTKASDLDKKPINRFETDIILNSTEAFESNNQKINSLNEEIQSLKRKLKTIYEKEEEIYKLQCEIKELKTEIQNYESLKTELNKLKIENQNLRDKNDKIQIEIMQNESLKQENKFLKTQLNEKNESNESKQLNDSEIEDIMTEDFKNDIVTQEIISHKEQIQINVPQLKTVLYNRLRTYHEKHIEELILNYNLDSKRSIDKETMEKILLEAIHI